MRTLTVIAAVLFALACATAATATGYHPKPPKTCPPGTTGQYPNCAPIPPVVPPVVVPPVVVPPRVCPDGLPPTPGEGAYDPNDDCKRPPTTTPPPVVVVPPPPTVVTVTVTVPGPERVVTKTKVVKRTVVKWKTRTKIKYVTRKPTRKPCPKYHKRLPNGACGTMGSG